MKAGASVKTSGLRAGSILLGRYELAEELGRGASAVVYRAFDSLLEQTVAVKVLIPARNAGLPVELRSNLRAEARAAMRLSHPHILRISNFEKDGDLDFLVMEFAPFGDCFIYRKRFPGACVPPRIAAHIVQQTLRGLEHAHENGVCHHDIKLSNLLLAATDPSPIVKICDFGLSALASSYVSGRRIVAGTPAYMAPERAAGKEGDHRSDLYSVAVMLFALANGITPFGSDASTLARQISMQPPERSVLPAPLHDVVLRGMAKDPAERYANAAEMCAALETALDGDRSSSQKYAGREVSGMMPDVWGPANEMEVALEEVDVILEDCDVVLEEEAGFVSEEAADAIRERERHASSSPPRSSVPPPYSSPYASSSPYTLPSPYASSSPYTSPSSPQSSSPPRTKLPSDPKEVAVHIPAGMRRILAAELISVFGSGTIQVAEFLMDEVEVTNAAYGQFVAATGALAPRDWIRNEPPPGMRDHPVVNVSLAEAQAYAAWVGKRLPTPAEWELAARGEEGRSFPWGHWDEALCNSPASLIGQTTSVHAFPSNVSPDGCLDMIGNVWEWTSGGDSHVDEAIPDTAWAYGGSFRHECAPEGHIARVEIQADNSFAYVGFRCAKSIR